MKTLAISIIALLLVGNGFAQERVRISVALSPTSSYPILIAQEKGIFEKNGLKAEIIRINSDATNSQALISGDIDAASGVPTGLVQFNLQGIAVVNLGSWDNQVSYTLMTKDKISDLSQLRGKKIGINRITGRSALILRVMLEDAGLNTSKDVTLLQLGGSQERLAALLRGGVDAAPVDFVFERKMQKIGFHLVPSKKTPFMNGPVMVTAANLKANRAKWTRFVKAYIEATHYMTVNKPGSIDVLKKFILPGEDNDTLDHVYEQMRDRATVNLITPDPAVENLIKMMTYVDKRSATIDRGKLSDYSIVRELIQNNAVPVKK
ncbi:MAG TPA: ABC transporter substrate-binding protein [Candidatus Binatia bacterium]